MGKILLCRARGPLQGWGQRATSKHGNLRGTCGPATESALVFSGRNGLDVQPAGSSGNFQQRLAKGTDGVSVLSVPVSLQGVVFLR